MNIHRRITITIVVLGLATIGLVAAVGVPTAIRVSDLRSSIIAKRQLIDRRYALRNYVRNSLAEIEKTRQELDSIRSIAVREGNELDFVTSLEDAATKTGVKMNIDLQTVNQQDLSTWEKWIPIRIDATGKFPQVTAFLNEVEHLPYYVIIDSIAVASPHRSGTVHDGTVQADFTGNVYWQAASVPDVLKVDNLSLDPPGN